MSNDDRQPGPHGGAELPRVVTLADVIARVKAHPELAPRRQRDLVSAIHTLCGALALDPALVGADPRSLRKRFAFLNPAMMGISKGRWNNVRSLILAAVTIAGVRMMPGRAREPLPDKWESLRSSIPGRLERFRLTRFMHFCAARGIAPANVDEAVFRSYGEALENESLVKRPVAVYREACLAWNRSAAAIRGWPSLVIPVPNRSHRYALNLADFPVTFGSDAEAFLNHLGNQDPLADDYARSARPITVRHRRQLLLQIATALVKAGNDITGITSLAVITQPANVKTALRFFLNRAGGQTTERIHHIASFIKSLARHWTRPGDQTIQEFVLLCSRLAPGRRGMTARNRERLRQFDDPANVAALLNLPTQLADEAGALARGAAGRQAALRLMFAVAIALLTNVPVRAENLAGLRLDRHIVRSRPGAKGVVHLVIPAREMKNDSPYEVELSASLRSLLDEYLAKAHPLLSPQPSPWLFPNENGERRNTGGFSRQIASLIRDKTGLVVNVHLFRHLAVKLSLMVNPEDIETPRRVLGHSSINTTLRSYSEMRSVEALRRYDEIIARLREAQPERGGSR